MERYLPRLDLRSTKALVITPKLQLAVKMLQMNNLDLTEFLQQKAESNPFIQLEIPTPSSREEAHTTENSSWKERTVRKEQEPYDQSGQDEIYDPFAQIATPVSLREHLTEQLCVAFPQQKERMIGALLIDALDPRGYLPLETLDTITQTTRASSEAIRLILQKMQHFTPIGIFASSLKESFKIQLEDTHKLDPVMEILIDNLELFGQGYFEKLEKLCNVSIAEIRNRVRHLRTLTPYPAASLDTDPLLPRIPDVIAKDLGDGDWILELNPETLPKILIDRTYHTYVSTRVHRKEDKEFVSRNFAEATWLERILEQRVSTILRVAREIMYQQSAFFEKGMHYLKPLTLKHIAEELNLHESTVSRVTSTKSILTPFGVLTFKFFFSSTLLDGLKDTGHAGISVCFRLKYLIEREPPSAPFSDEQLATLLFKEDGIVIARRTVTKYRDSLRIPKAAQRRRMHKMSAAFEE
ncbi:MAG: RNA polymerase factor sigma-54 [Holosporales bacterium]|jgi:RNA polymerase sigma-54 factor|nr:RNA polymerase factor sigma-54 [Holosporales bacterium]